MSKLPAPPSFKSTIIQITPNSSSTTTKNSNSQKNSAENSYSNINKRQISSDTVSFLNSSSSANNNPKRQKVKLSEKSLEEIERKKKENKAAHSIIEKKRRIKLNREFEALKIIVPACRNSIINNNYNNNNGHSTTTNDASKDKINDGMYKLTILQASVDYINYLHEIIRIMHMKEKKLNAQLGHLGQQDNDDSHIAFAKLDLKLEKYRDLDIDFKYIEIMKIFKYMNAYSRIVNNDKIGKKRNSSYDAKLNYFVNPESINLYDDSDFDKFLLTKGIKQADIDTFHLFFEIVNVSKNPEVNNSISDNNDNASNDDSNNNDVKFKSSIFSILDKLKTSTEQNNISQLPNILVTQDNLHSKLQRQRNDINNINNSASYNILNTNINNTNQSKYSVSGSSASSSYTAPTTVTPATSLLNQPYNISIFNNTSPAINWKKFSPNISPATKYLDTSLMMKLNNSTTTNLSNEFQLPQPLIDIPIKLERQNSMNGFTEFLNKGNHTSNNSGMAMSPTGILGCGSGNTFQHSGSPNLISSRSSNNGIKINTSLNIGKSSNSSEFFTLSPMTFSSIIKSPKFEGIIGSNFLIGGTNIKEKKGSGECKMASEALMLIRKRSNSGSYMGLNNSSILLNDNNNGIMTTENYRNEDNNNFSTSPNNNNTNTSKKDSSTVDETGKRFDSKINTILN